MFVVWVVVVVVATRMRDRPKRVDNDADDEWWIPMR